MDMADGGKVPQGPTTNGHSEMNGHESDGEVSSGADFASSSIGIPSSILIVTNIAEATFLTSSVRDEFEQLFHRFDPAAEIHYLRSFRRARIVFQSLESSIRAHTELFNYLFHDLQIKCYYAQPPIETRNGENKFLEPPPLEKQYLISPPASPPVGWEVINEREPYVNYDLINAIASMGPGESYQVHTGNEEQPSIVVHVCEDPIDYAKRPKKIVQTKRPDKKTADDSKKPDDDDSKNP